jgi:hypothetical protein
MIHPIECPCLSRSFAPKLVSPSKQTESSRERQYISAHHVFASTAGLKQRRGRAGRVREGTCYKLISRRTYSNLSEHGEPEIQRSALDQAILSLLFLGMDCNPTPGGFLDSLLDPPSKVRPFSSAKLAVWKVSRHTVRARLGVVQMSS